MIHGNGDCQTRLVSMKVPIISLNKQTRKGTVQNQFGVTFLTRMALGVMGSSPTSSSTSHPQTTDTHPILTILCEATLSSLFHGNRKLQSLFMQAFLKAPVTSVLEMPSPLCPLSLFPFPFLLACIDSSKFVSLSFRRFRSFVASDDIHLGISKKRIWGSLEILDGDSNNILSLSW